MVLSPLDFISRLASLVPPPWQNLTRYYGVFATASKHRSRVMTWPQRLKTIHCFVRRQITREHHQNQSTICGSNNIYLRNARLRDE
ncbi:MAG: transposase [Pseudomonadales bacterium]|nr:transposase [Pseudomonadales bacterium]